MKNFFTWCVAALLFGLCVVEKEARRSAVLLEIEERTYIQTDRINSETQENHNIIAKSNFQAVDQMAASEEINGNAFTPSDSMNVGLAQDHNKVF